MRQASVPLGFADAEAGERSAEAEYDVGIPDAGIAAGKTAAQTAGPGAGERTNLMDEVYEAEQGGQAGRLEELMHHACRGSERGRTGGAKHEDDGEEDRHGERQQKQSHPQTARAVKHAEDARHTVSGAGHAAAHTACDDAQTIDGHTVGRRVFRDAEGGELGEEMRLDHGHVEAAGEEAERDALVGGFLQSRAEDLAKGSLGSLSGLTLGAAEVARHPYRSRDEQGNDEAEQEYAVHDAVGRHHRLDDRRKDADAEADAGGHEAGRDVRLMGRERLIDTAHDKAVRSACRTRGEQYAQRDREHEHIAGIGDERQTREHHAGTEAENQPS